jgi:hypothetical protein
MRFSDDGWFDATTAAREFGKAPNDFSLTETDSH